MQPIAKIENDIWISLQARSSLEVEPPLALLARLFDEGSRDVLDVLGRVDRVRILQVALERAPSLVAFVLLHQCREVKQQTLLLSGAAEVQFGAGVEALWEAGLCLGHAVVEGPVEIGHLRVVQLADSHAVSEDDATGCLLVEVLLVELLGLKADRVDLHLVFGACPRVVEVIISSQHFYEIINYIIIPEADHKTWN